jgi:putative copper export protein/mono/diheme cytochrome c family protein
MSWLEVATALVRGLHVAALLSTFGCLTFRLFVVPAGVDVLPSVLRIGVASTWLALLFGGAWLAAVACAIAGVQSPASVPGAILAVARYTSFGNLLCARLLLVASILVLLPRVSAVAAMVAAGIALALQPFLGHAGALEGSVRTVLVAVEIAHLLAAGAWLGGLMPLLVCVLRVPVPLGTTLCERFTPVGLVGVGTIMVTALPQAGEMIGGLPALFGTQYGHWALVKLGLFLLALCLACANRLVLTARLGATVARRALIGSVGIEIIAVFCVVLAASAMASSPPAIHVQPVWPFAWRPSTVVWAEPELRGELIRLLIAATAGAVLIAGSLVLRRFRIFAVCLAVIIVIPFWSALGLLLVEAYPTSYARSTTGFSVAGIARGETLFNQQCAACHDPRIGSGATADLTAPHIWGHREGELFWWITNGITDPEGAALMPGFGPMFSEDDVWALIDFIHARSVGVQAVKTGKWAPPMPAPIMPLNCDGGEAFSLTDLGPHDLLIAAGNDPAGSDPEKAGERSVPGAETIRLVRDAAGKPGEGECVAASPEAWEAWRVLSGAARDRFGGYRALVDSQGWVRAWLPPGSGPEAALAAIRDANANPIAASARAVEEHRH